MDKFVVEIIGILGTVIYGAVVPGVNMGKCVWGRRKITLSGQKRCDLESWPPPNSFSGSALGQVYPIKLARASEITHTPTLSIYLLSCSCVARRRQSSRPQIGPGHRAACTTHVRRDGQSDNVDSTFTIRSATNSYSRPTQCGLLDSKNTLATATRGTQGVGVPAGCIVAAEWVAQWGEGS